MASKCPDQTILIYIGFNDQKSTNANSYIRLRRQHQEQSWEICKVTMIFYKNFKVPNNLSETKYLEN